MARMRHSLALVKPLCKHGPVAEQFANQFAGWPFSRRGSCVFSDTFRQIAGAPTRRTAVRDDGA